MKIGDHTCPLMTILVGTRRRLAKAAALWFSYSTKAYLRGLERSFGDGYRITLVTPSVRASISTCKKVDLNKVHNPLVDFAKCSIP